MGQQVSALTNDQLGALFTRAAAGDQEAMGDALEAIEPRIRAMCRRYEQQMTRDPALAFDDLLQYGRLVAINAVRGWTDCGIPSTAYISVRLRSYLHQWVKSAGDANASAMRLDKPVGEYGRPAGELGGDPALSETQEMDLELEDLFDRLPRGSGISDENLAHRLRPGRIPNRLPDDETLAGLVRQGTTLDEMVQMFGVAPTTIQKRLAALRRSGTAVPTCKRPEAGAWGEMHRVPWGEKLRMIEEYLDSHPGVSKSQAYRDLGIGLATLNKAKVELAQRCGEGRE